MPPAVPVGERGGAGDRLGGEDLSLDQGRVVPQDHPSASLHSWKSFCAHPQHVQLQLEVHLQQTPLLAPWCCRAPCELCRRTLSPRLQGHSPCLHTGSIPACSCRACGFSWKQESAGPLSGEAALGNFCHIELFGFVLMSGWRPGLRVRQSLPLRRARDVPASALHIRSTSGMEGPVCNGIMG